MTTATLILAALAKLDTANHDHWTADGLPRLDVVKQLAGDANISRDMVTVAAPGFSRTVPLPAVAVQTAPPVTEQPQALTPAAVLTAADTRSDDDTLESGNGTLEGLAGGGDTNAQAQPQASGGTLEECLEDAQLELKRLRGVASKAAQAVAAQVEAVDKLINAVIEAQRQGNTQSPIQGYLQRQKAELEQRGERMRTMKAAGIDMKMLQAVMPKKAPIDQAMQRKTARGGQRPKSLV